MSSTKKSQINKIETRLDADNLSPIDKMHCYHWLIQLKRRKESDNEDLYWLTKKLIENYIESISGRKYADYDNIQVRKILKFASPFDLNQKLSILKFTSRELRNHQYDDEAREIEIEVNKLELKATWDIFGLRKPFKILFHLSTYNLLTTIISLLLIPITAVIVFMPANFEYFELFKIAYVPICKGTFWNHLANCILMLIGMDGLKVTPTGLAGTMILFIGKTVFFVFILNTLVDKVNKYLIR